MRPDDDRARLTHMLEAARDARAFIHNRQPDDLTTDRQLGFAVMHALEIIGEAAGHISDAGRAALPTIPWPQVIGMRHRLIHAYFDVNYRIVWDTVTQALPPVIAALEQFFATERLP